MRLSRALPALGAAALLAVTSAVPAAAQKSYPVVCKAGGNMMAEVSAGNTVRVRFNPGRQGAGSTPPSAGECAWLDRGFRSGEPNILLVQGNGRHASYIIDAVRKGETFYAHIYNNRRGAMVVDRIGP
ncbi:hypothetical protein [Dichotomicrobium thermohalophilum]|uniref:Peptidase inhibitor family I36 n=1 Tax=Dichotomicrobium thermohalophilum TaxID=933063 RepID=A0A397Q589_9HYPH|nr:hypothetical protein [Dichotomicrobium thermohalophilum]RIA56218.1 hypothetical protein BXY53_1320 [Dichotomicrobium thermohalophilum]